MYNTVWTVLLLGGSLVAASPATATGGCGRVQVSCHAASQRTSARQFCTKYLAQTKTVTGTEATTTVTVTSGASTVTASGSICPGGSYKEKRAKGGEPACLASFPSGTALSSACSCITQKKVTSTTTVGTGTTITQTTTVPSTTITTFALVTPSCSTVTKANYPHTSGGARSNSYYPGPATLTYTAFFASCGVTENSDNPGDDYNLTVELDSSYDTCEAVNQCALNAAQGPNEGTFDLYRQTNGDWQCLLYGGLNSDPSYFNVSNSDVLESYGYNNAQGVANGP